MLVALQCREIVISPCDQIPDQTARYQCGSQPDQIFAPRDIGIVFRMREELRLLLLLPLVLLIVVQIALAQLLQLDGVFALQDLDESQRFGFVDIGEVLFQKRSQIGLVDEGFVGDSAQADRFEIGDGLRQIGRYLLFGSLLFAFGSCFAGRAFGL